MPTSSPPLSVGACTHDGFSSPAEAATSLLISNCTFVGHRLTPHRVSTKTGEQKKAPLVITGCARRIAAALANSTIPYIDRLLTEATLLKYAPSVLIFHDDPSDNTTLGVLMDWAAREKRVRLILSDMANRGERIQRLALCRNVLLAEASARMPEEHPTSYPIGYVASLDLDCKHGEPSALLQALGTMRSADMTAASPSSAFAAEAAAQRFDVLTANNHGAYRYVGIACVSPTMDYDCFWDFTDEDSRQLVRSPFACNLFSLTAPLSLIACAARSIASTSTPPPHPFP